MQLLRGRTIAVDALAVSLDARYVVAGGPGACHAWDLRDPKAVPRVLDRSPARTHKLTFASDTTVVAFQEFHRSEEVHWWRYDLEAGTGVELASPKLASPRPMIVHPSGRLLKASPRQRGLIETFRLSDDESGWVSMGGSKHDDNWLLVYDASGDRYVAREYNYRDTVYKYRLRDTRTDAVVATFDQFEDRHPFALKSWAFTPDERRAFTVSDRWLYAYDCAAGGLPVLSLRLPEGGAVKADVIYSNGHVSAVQALAVHPDGRRVATVEDHRTVSLRDADTLRVMGSYDFAMPKVTCVAFTPDGTRCVVGNTRGKVLLFDVE